MSPLARTALFTVLVPGSVAGWIPAWLARTAWGRPRAALEPAAPLGWVLVAGGALLYLACALDFARVGRGTPLPVDAPRRLVVTGPYRFTRNPMYWGVGTALAGHALLRASPLLFLWLALWMLGWHLFVVWYEETTLRRRFGESYERYCSAVPRWSWRLRAYSEDRGPRA